MSLGPDLAFQAITEAKFTEWVLTLLRRCGYLAAHVNAIGTCQCCRRRKCPCGARAVAKMEPGLPDIIAVSPFEKSHPLILVELKTESGQISTKRGSTGGKRPRVLPSQNDWLTALWLAGRRLDRSRATILSGICRPAGARAIQEAVQDDGREHEPWELLDREGGVFSH